MPALLDGRVAPAVGLSSFYALSVLVAYYAGAGSFSGRRLQARDAETDTGGSSCWLERRSTEPVELAFLRLQSELFSQRRLPVSAFGLGREPLTKKQVYRFIGNASYVSYYDQVAPVTQRAVTRIALVRFLGRAMQRISHEATASAHASGRRTRCLEWDAKWYLARYKACEEPWSFSLMNRVPSVSMKDRSFRGDLNEIASQHPQLLGTFDIIFCSQVFEHVSRPHVSAAGIAALLAPSGFLIFTAPFIEPTHGVPFDYFRYTVSGATQLFEDVGLTTVMSEKSGDAMMTSAFLHGFSIAELNRTMGYDVLNAVLTTPVTRKTIDEMERGGVRPDMLAQKIYTSVFLVARAPRDDHEGRRYTWTRQEQMVPPSVAKPSLTFRTAPGQLLPPPGVRVGRAGTHPGSVASAERGRRLGVTTAGRSLAGAPV